MAEINNNVTAIGTALRNCSTNPLRIDDKPGSDTRYMVRSVLAFMAEAFDALESTGDVISEGAMTGCARIMNICHDALKEADIEKSDLS